jgi:hypothetical protein
MNNTSITQILSMPPGSTVDSVQGTVVDVYKQRTIPSGKTVQDGKLKDGTGAEIMFSVWEHDDISTYKGREVIISGGPKSIMKVELDKFKDRNVNKLSVSRTCTFQFLEVHRAQTGTPAPAPTTRAEGPSTPAPILVNGAKIGMAINNAVSFMTSAGEPFSSDRLWQVASEIVLISNKMEMGEIAPPAKAEAEDLPY